MRGLRTIVICSIVLCAPMTAWSQSTTTLPPTTTLETTTTTTTTSPTTTLTVATTSTTIPPATTTTLAICGNGIVEGTEQCDDGPGNSDSVADACRTTCFAASCGDGVEDFGETCDDGNLMDGDGCDTNCAPTACGNGVASGSEQCDDGNLVDGDGCSPTCETGPESGIVASIVGGGIGGVTFDSSGNIVFSDAGKHQILRVLAGGTLAVVAGSGVPGFSGDHGAAIHASFDTPGALAFDSNGNLFVSDRGNYRIRRISPNGVVTTVAGTGTPSSSGDGGNAALANILGADAIAIGSDGSLYLADAVAHAVRRIDLLGHIERFAGTGVPGESGDGGPAISANLLSPVGLAVGSDSTVYILQGNGHIRAVPVDGNISTLATPNWIDGSESAATALAWEGDHLLAASAKFAGGQILRFGVDGGPPGVES